jgi:hypothetical protein
MSNPQFVNLKLATASPSLCTSFLHATGYTPSPRLSAPDAPQPESAVEAIVNLRHVVAGIAFALVIEGAVAVAIFATWNLWHIR